MKRGIHLSCSRANRSRRLRSRARWRPTPAYPCDGQVNGDLSVSRAFFTAMPDLEHASGRNGPEARGDDSGIPARAG